MLSPWSPTTRRPNWTRQKGHAPTSHSPRFLCFEHPTLCWAGQPRNSRDVQSGRFGWDRRPGALTCRSVLAIDALTYKKRARETGTAIGFLVSFVRKDRATKTPPATDIASERHYTFGASAPSACPLKTGITRSLARAGEVRAAFILNGKPMGVPHVVSEPRHGVRSRRWKVPRGQGLKGMDFALTRLSSNRCLAGCFKSSCKP